LHKSAGENLRREFVIGFVARDLAICRRVAVAVLIINKAGEMVLPIETVLVELYAGGNGGVSC
jgi:hypothetical protein